MSISLINSFQKIVENRACSFTKLVGFTEKVERNHTMLRQETIRRFISLVAQLFKTFEDNHVSMCDHDWQIFDTKFSHLLQTQSNKDELLELVRTIEDIAQRHFTKLDDSLVPIALSQKVVLVSKKSLNSKVFQTMLLSPFIESKKRKIDLTHLTRPAFAIVAAILENKPFKIPQEFMLEVLDFAYAHGYTFIFNEAFSQLVEALKSQSSFNNNHHLKESFNFLCLILGIESTSGNEKKIQSQIPEANLVRNANHARAANVQPENALGGMDAFYSQMMTKDQVVQNKLLELLCLFGECFEKGFCVKRQAATALKLYRFGEKFDCSQALVRIGICYKEGIGVAEDWSRAAEYFKHAADQGNMHGQFWLAMAYDEGEGVPVDWGKATEYFKLAADQGLDTAQWDVGLRYFWGNGLPHDVVESFKYFGRAADQGDNIAKFLKYVHVIPAAIELTAKIAWAHLRGERIFK